MADSGRKQRRADESEALAWVPFWRRSVYAVLTMAIAVTIFLVIAEVVCRILPVNQGLRAQPVNAETPIFRFAADRSATWSEGWDFAIVNTVRVNNAGFVNDHDYDPAATSPLIAVIGDSYIEAGIVPSAETVQGRLAAAAGVGGRVYSFAASGAGLSQYLVWAAHAADVYRPDAFVFTIIANDFSEALWHHGRSPGFHHFERLSDGTAELRRVDYAPSTARQLLRRSALAMYLVTNVKAHTAFDVDVQALGDDDQRWVGNIAAEATDLQLDDYQWAVDRFLERLPEATGVAADRIIIMADGIRPQLYQPQDLVAAEDSVWAIMRRYVLSAAAAQGHVAIDLQDAFIADHDERGQRFEFPTDSHWNGVGHEVAAQAIMATPTYREVFAETASP